MYDGFSATHSLKCLPESETDSYVLGFIRGWFAGDGSVGTDGRASICCHEDGLQWLLKNAERAGFVVQTTISCRVPQIMENVNGTLTE
jgi:hypothetical protein